MIGLVLKDIVCKENICIQSTASLKQLVELMDLNQKGVAVIVEDGKPTEILTERDIVEILYNGTNLDENVNKYAKKELITTKGNRTIGYALNLMVENNIRRIIVTDESNNFIGVLTYKDMIRYLEEDFYRSAVKVKHIMENLKPLINISPEDSLNNALREMVEKKISAIPVLKEGRAVGIITEKDILKMARNNISFNENAGRFMSSPVISVTPENSLVDVVKIMNANNMRRVIIENSDGKAVGIITDRDLLRNLDGDYTSFIERKLKHTKDVLNLLPEMLIEIVDMGGEQFVVWVNEKVISKFGRDMVDKPITNFIPPDKWGKIYGTLLRFNKVENIKLKKNGEIYEISGFLIKTEGHIEKGKIQMILRDITEDVKLYTTDPLTGIYNRRFLNEFIMKELERSKRFNKQFSIVIADIDDFKRINDTYSHLSGDSVLRSISQIMLKTIRNTDVIGRYGGEEFVIIMPETPKNTAAFVSERLRNRIEKEPISISDGNRLTITASFGIASFPEDGGSSVDLLIASDDRLYKAKKEGKNRIAFN